MVEIFFKFIFICLAAVLSVPNKDSESRKMLNCWQGSIIVVVLQCFVVLGLNVGVSNGCTSSSFTRVPGNVLVGFVIGDMKVSSFFECIMRCTFGVNCLSLNFLSNHNGSLVCQLNNALKENATRHHQFVPHDAGEYVSFTVRF